jgi:hypothetical protein
LRGRRNERNEKQLSSKCLSRTSKNRFRSSTVLELVLVLGFYLPE